MTNPGATNSRDPIVLVVEEEEGIRNLLKLTLSTNGFQVLLAASGEEALVLSRQRNHDIDLILMDVRMNGLDGAETLALLQKSRKDIRCCFMSGDTSLERADELLALGARRVFRKPFDSLQDVIKDIRIILES